MFQWKSGNWKYVNRASIPYSLFFLQLQHSNIKCSHWQNNKQNFPLKLPCDFIQYFHSNPQWQAVLLFVDTLHSMEYTVYSPIEAKSAELGLSVLFWEKKKLNLWNRMEQKTFLSQSVFAVILFCKASVGLGYGSLHVNLSCAYLVILCLWDIA